MRCLHVRSSKSRITKSSHLFEEDMLATRAIGQRNLFARAFQSIHNVDAQLAVTLQTLTQVDEARAEILSEHLHRSIMTRDVTKDIIS